jgi:DNA-binding transcriptional LysR family regulator
VSILPASFQRVQLSEMRWLPIDEQDAVSEMWLVWSKHHEQGHWQNAFVNRCSPGKASIIEAKRGWKCAVNHKAK